MKPTASAQASPPVLKDNPTIVERDAPTPVREPGERPQAAYTGQQAAQENLATKSSTATVAISLDDGPVSLAADGNMLLEDRIGHYSDDCLTSVSKPVKQALEAHRGLSQRLGCVIAADKPVTIIEKSYQRGGILHRNDREISYLLYGDGKASIGVDTKIITATDSNIWSVPPAAVTTTGHIFNPSYAGDVRSVLGDPVASERTSSGKVVEFQGGTMLWSNRQFMYILYLDGTWRSLAEPPD